MSSSGYQLFVRSDDREAVEAAIRAHVAEHAGSHSADPDADGDSTNLADRKRRTFALSPPVDRTITVWEDGMWSDRRMAKSLSGLLGTEVVWLMLNEVHGSWAFARHRDGEEIERQHDVTADVEREARGFARAERLPFAFEYLPNPNADARVAELIEQLKAAGQWELKCTPEELAQEYANAETEVEIVYLRSQDAAVELLDGDEAIAEPTRQRLTLDSVRDDLREFSVEI